MPKSILMLMEAPFASGVPKVIVPDDQVELNAPPFACDGGSSNVVPCTLTVQGVVATPLDARQVAASLIPETTTSDDVRARRSAIPEGAGNVLTSMSLYRNLVTAPPVLFTTRRRKSMVPKVKLFAGSLVKSRARFGERAADTVESNIKNGNCAVRWIGDDRFCGPGAPRRCPAPELIPFVSTK